MQSVAHPLYSQLENIAQYVGAHYADRRSPRAAVERRSCARLAELRAWVDELSRQWDHALARLKSFVERD